MEQAPATNPGLLANLVSRVILAFASILVSWVPFRLLVRNGEFAAVVFIVDVATMNSITIVNSVIWHDDDWSTWWDGAGLCDIEVYLMAPLQTIYAASIFTIMYHLAQQVKITGAARGRSERTRRNIIQAAIIFPIPSIQLIFTWFDLAQRYIIGTLIGCSAVYDASWPKILVYDAPPAVFALLAVPYAVLLWRRYHAITKQAQGILKSDGEASIRANRTRRRLYNMSLSILVVYVPIMIYFLVCNIKDTLPSYKAYDYNRMHWSATPYPWETILFVPSWIIPSDVINQPWISIATTVVIMAFFGMTMEARQIYRQYAGYLQLQTCFQKLKLKKDQGPSPGDGSGKTLENGKTLLPNHIRNSVKYQYAAYSSCRAPTTADTAYSENRTNHQSLFSRGRDSIIPTIERSNTARATGDPSHVPLPARTAISTPPAIPPRYSSLRSSFAFRTPTFQSIRKSIRIPSLRSRATSGIGASSSSSSKTTGERTELSRDDAVPMLPLYYNALRGDDTTGLRRAMSPFLVGDDAPPPPLQGGVSRAKCGPGGLEERGFQVRVPIIAHHQVPFSTPDERRGVDYHAAASVQVRGAESASFPREQTFASLYTTTTDTRTNRSRASAGREVGVAKPGSDETVYGRYATIEQANIAIRRARENLEGRVDDDGWTGGQLRDGRLWYNCDDWGHEDVREAVLNRMAEEFNEYDQFELLLANDAAREELIDRIVDESDTSEWFERVLDSDFGTEEVIDRIQLEHSQRHARHDGPKFEDVALERILETEGGPEQILDYLRESTRKNDQQFEEFVLGKIMEADHVVAEILEDITSRKVAALSNRLRAKLTRDIRRELEVKIREEIRVETASKDNGASVAIKTEDADELADLDGARRRKRARRAY
ncbi:hypothetical protein FHL15_007906 [Xylaria flabelliformis]|uniref:Uncharacterized protein n=1 Tax=Xylaria flabelliformis TaxID=2512241 RepID=A0A553HT33_9PEZI|nr:hypothetical protein FHL15_007906 [Xylaria flabelliformis]